MVEPFRATTRGTERTSGRDIASPATQAMGMAAVWRAAGAHPGPLPGLGPGWVPAARRAAAIPIAYTTSARYFFAPASLMCFATTSWYAANQSVAFSNFPPFTIQICTSPPPS
jgi:hypothetical protein